MNANEKRSAIGPYPIDMRMAMLQQDMNERFFVKLFLRQEIKNGEQLENPYRIKGTCRCCVGIRFWVWK